MFVASPPCEGCQWLSSGQLSDQQSSTWLCSLVNQTERRLRNFEDSGNLCRCFELISWLACHHNLICWDNWWVFVKCEPKIITIKRTKDLNYFSLCALNLFNIQFHNLSWITEINELFHDVLIYWDAPVYIWVSLSEMSDSKYWPFSCIT